MITLSAILASYFGGAALGGEYVNYKANQLDKQVDEGIKKQRTKLYLDMLDTDPYCFLKYSQIVNEEIHIPNGDAGCGLLYSNEGFRRIYMSMINAIYSYNGLPVRYGDSIEPKQNMEKCLSRAVNFVKIGLEAYEMCQLTLEEFNKLTCGNIKDEWWLKEKENVIFEFLKKKHEDVTDMMINHSAPGLGYPRFFYKAKKDGYDKFYYINEWLKEKGIDKSS